MLIFHLGMRVGRLLLGGRRGVGGLGWGHRYERVILQVLAQGLQRDDVGADAGKVRR